MTEKSIMWTTGSTGDGASEYTQAEVIRWLRQTFINDNTNEGVLKNYGNELEVTGSSSPVAVNTGAAYVYGFPYWNTSSENVTVATPSGDTRIDRIVLQADWTAQTVRIARHAGSEGGSAPSLTQTDGTTWEISLAQVSITTGGVITVTDERTFCHPNIEVEPAMVLDRTRKFFVPAVVGYNDDTSTVISLSTDSNYAYIALPDSVDSYAFGNFHVPEDFSSGMTVETLCRGGGSGANVRGLTYAMYGADGQGYATHENGSAATEAITTTDTANNLMFSTSLSSAATGDIVSIRFTRDGDNAADTYSETLHVLGWVVEYTADS